MDDEGPVNNQNGRSSPNLNMMDDEELANIFLDDPDYAMRPYVPPAWSWKPTQPRFDYGNFIWFFLSFHFIYLDLCV